MTEVLLLCDDHWHPAEVIELGIVPLEQDYRFTVVKTAKDILTPAFLSKFPLVVCCKGNAVNAANTAPWYEEGVTEVMAEEFEAYVRNGGGFLSLHSGNTWKENDAHARFIGNHFQGHPPRCTVQVSALQNSHPISQGVEDFSIRDEHYRISLLCDDAEIFCRTHSETGGTQIGGYTRVLDKGRLCVLTPGHTLAVWETPSFLQLLHQSMEWCLQYR